MKCMFVCMNDSSGCVCMCVSVQRNDINWFFCVYMRVYVCMYVCM